MHLIRYYNVKNVSQNILEMYMPGVDLVLQGQGALAGVGFSSLPQVHSLSELIKEPQKQIVSGPLTNATGDGGRAQFKGGKDGRCILSGLSGSGCLECMGGRKGISGKGNSMSKVRG